MTLDSSLVTYYAEEEDLHPRLASAGKFFSEDVLSTLQEPFHKEVILAGGALRSFFTDTHVRDYDLYMSKDLITNLNADSHSWLLSFGGWMKVAETEKSWTWKKSSYVQGQVKNTALNIIKQPYDSPQAVIDQFDMTVCMCAITKDQITYHPDYFIDIATRKLRFHSLEHPLNTLWRLQKYIKMGYEVEKSELWRLVEAIHDMPKLNPVEDDVKEKDLLVIFGGS